MLVRDLQMRPTVANGSGRGRLVMGVINLQLGEIGMYFSVSRSRVRLKTCLDRQRDFNIALSILNLYISWRVQSYLDCAILVLQANIAGNTIQTNILGTGRKTQRSGQ